MTPIRKPDSLRQSRRAKRCPLFLFGVFLLLVLGCSPESPSKQHEEAEIRRVLEEQLTMWNRGDIDGFMQGYITSDSLLFVGSSGVMQGYNALLTRYKTRYDTPEKRGTLHFAVLHLTFLRDDCAYVVGRWTVERNSDSLGTVSGYFTLIFKKYPHGWKILLDHTS